ncbi:phosphopyruvate hydratase [bacterium]|nr:phosphopyruvate hydratase [bacterium]
MSIITGCWAREVLDSRGIPTVEVEIELNSGIIGRAIVPSGSSKGTHEVLELRDGDESRYNGKGVLKAVENVNSVIAPEILELDARDQAGLDQILIELDGTKDKSKLGANAILGVSAATVRAASIFLGLPLYQYIGGIGAKVMPIPHVNVINGGAHAPNRLDLQEFTLVPAGAKSFREAIRMSSEIFHALKKYLISKGHITSVGDEGGFAPNIASTEEAFQALITGIELARYIPGDDVYVGLDAAISDLHVDGIYNLPGENKKFDTDSIIEFYSDLLHKYPIISIEDPLAEDDWNGWVKINKELGDKVQIVGDDIFVTDIVRIQKGITLGVSNAALIKLNQIGTVSETLDAIELAQRAAWGTVISHRSGETEDDFIADLAVSTNTGQIKTGSVQRSERIVKYNRLFRIEEQLEGISVFPKAKDVFPHLKFKNT